MVAKIKIRRLGLLLAVFATAVHAENRMSLTNQAASTYSGTASLSAAASSNKVENPPGVSWVTLRGSNSQEAERAMKARVLPPNLNQGVSSSNTGSKTVMAMSVSRVAGDTAAAGPASIAELARALKKDPDLIYEYVRNNIEYYPAWGVQKGALGTILDNQGGAFDQAALMVALLRESGYVASFVRGRISLTAADVKAWLGVDVGNSCAIDNLLSSAQIPFSTIDVANCPGTAPPLSSIKIDHVWVKVLINGVGYYFDPSFKPHTLKSGLNLASITGYTPSSYLASAKSGATVTADYVQNINRTNIRSSLSGYANALSSYIRGNFPAGGLDDVMGGKVIVPHSGEKLRNESLPYRDSSVPVVEWTDIPNELKPVLTISYSGIVQPFTSDAIYGRRLTITYNGSNQPVLSLDGSVIATGAAVVPGTKGVIRFDITHPYYDKGLNKGFTQNIKAGGTFLISNAWGPSGRGLVEYHRRRLDEARAAGGADGSEAVLGSTLAVLSSTWLAQNSQSNYMVDRLAKTNTLIHREVGIAGYNTAPYVDLPGGVVTVVSENADRSKASAAFYSSTMHSSIFESASVQQTAGVSAVSTVKLIDMAAANGDKIFDAKSNNYSSVVQPALTSCTGSLAGFQDAVNQGYRLILPARCNLSEASWSGAGYFVVAPSGSTISAMIGGGLAGGESTSPLSVFDTVTNALVKALSSDSLAKVGGQIFGDPIEMVKGSYLYTKEDLVTGVGEFPHSLSLQKLYSSGARTQSGALGKGWTHNFASSVAVGSDGFQGMGEDSALDAVATIVEQMVSLDLLSDASKPLDKMVVATIGQRWFGDQLIDNTAIVQQGLNGEVFVKLPDGSYNAPPGKPNKLIKNGDGTYSYETIDKARLNFNSAGRIATFVHPSGVQANFTYSGSDLTQVQNSLGRTLTFTNSAGRITQVSDGTRTVKYAYDASGNLVTYTDATNQNTTFQYDLPGRITKVFNPSNLASPFVTNVYDSLGRVATQTNPNGKLFSYYFAGSRSEEVAPDGGRSVTYLDGQGNVLKKIDQSGRVVANTYDGQSRLIKRVFPEGNSVEYEYDDASCLSQLRCTHNTKTVRQVPKAGSGLANLVSSFTYESSFNKVATATDPRGQVTNYTYTAQGMPLTVTAPADTSGERPSTTFGYTAYTPAGFPSIYLQTSATSKTAANLTLVTGTTYNASNKYVPQSAINDFGAGRLNLTTTFTYDGTGNLTQADGPRTDVSDIVSMAYDAERRVIQKTDALGKVSYIAYDADGRAVRTASQIGSQWLVSCSSYTLSGKVLKTWGPAQTAASTTCPTAAAPTPVTDYAYDDNDRLLRVTENLTAAEGGNRVSEMVYNLDGSVQSVKRAVGTAIAQTYSAFTYTNNGLPATVKDAKNNLTTYQYDGFDRRIKTLYPDKTVAGTSSSTDYEQSGFDANGNVISLRKRNGQTVSLTYDNLNRLVGRTYPTTADNVIFMYDLLGRRIVSAFADHSYSTLYSWDSAGRLRGTTSGDAYVEYAYDEAGNRTRVKWPDGYYVTTDYDALNRPTAIRDQAGTSFATYAYDDLSRRTSVTLGNGTTTTYGYSATQGALSNLAHNLAGTAQDQSYSYTRNQVRDIVQNSWNNDSYQWTGAINGTKAYVSNGLNQYATVGANTFSYDGNGNLTGDGYWSYGYDLENRLKTATAPGYSASLAYDAEGRLRQTNLGGSVTNLVYDGTALIAEYDDTRHLLNRYVHGPGLDEPLVSLGRFVGTESWFYADHQGSIVGQANSAGTSTAIYSYGPYGEPNVTTGSRFRYTGQQYLSSLGLYYYKARFYAPMLGRFLQTDPIGYQDDVNMYAYVGNSPSNKLDPLGLSAQQAAGLKAGIGGLSFENAEQVAMNTAPDGDNIAQRGAGIGGVYGGGSSAIGGGASAARGLAGVPGRVGARINLSNEGMEHVIGRHLSGKANASQFSLSEAELRSVLSSPAAVNSPVVRSVESADGIRYVREFDAGRVIGADKFNGNQATSVMTIMTDRFGNLISTFPGLLK